MTKTKKIAAVAVSVVLAGSMAVSLTACGKKDKAVNSYGEGVVNMALADEATLNVAIGYNSTDTGLFYGQNMGTMTTFVGGYKSYAYGPKPAAQAIMDATGITLKDSYDGSSTSANLGNLVNSTKWNSTVDLATSDLSVAIEQANAGTVLNLADYLDYMPNFKAFLEENPIVYLSVMGEWKGDNNDEQTLYVAPYFDGMDDIEKGVLMRQDWVEAVLDDANWSVADNASGSNSDKTGTNKYGVSDDTFEDACWAVMYTDKDGNAVNSAGEEVKGATGTSATSYMGTTGSWTITSTDEDGEGIVTIKKDYSAALNSVTTGESELNKAFLAIAGSSYSVNSLTSGNIVDLMNAALETTESNALGMKATGKEMAALYRAYVDAAYSVDGSAYYGSGNNLNPYSDIFNGYSACWDVDDLVALLRIIKCSSGQVGLETVTVNGESVQQKTVGIFPRSYDNQRTPDIISLVGELYGCRGATSRYENVYFDGEGNVQDARADEKFWDSLEAFGGIAREGLVDSGYILNDSYNTSDSNYYRTMHGEVGYTSTELGFMQWDYSQTQTTQEFDDETIRYGWVNTPVSIWDDGTASDVGYSYSGDDTTAGAQGKYMRFTDSWRSTKTAGLVVAKNVENDEKKLAAALKFVDFLYSNDGQITTTYAIQSTAGDTNPNGTWYGIDVTNDMISSVSGAANYTDLCEENYQYVIKDEYSKNYVVCGGKICDKDGEVVLDENGEELSVETYAERVSDWTVKKEYQDQCFAFGGKLYKGESYKGKQTPKITTELFEHFTAISTDSDETKAEINVFPSVRGSFTNFARYILGSTLPICVKDQSFENQMTADFAKDQATKVSVSLANNTISHCELDVTNENYFYTCVPTSFPFSYNEDQTINNQNVLEYTTGTAYGGSNAFWSIYHQIIWFGYDGAYTLNSVNVVFGGTSGISGADTMVTYLQGLGLSTRISCVQSAWTRALGYWNIIKGNN